MLQYKLEKPTLINLLFLRLDYLWCLNFKKKNPFYLVQNTS